MSDAPQQNTYIDADEQIGSYTNGLTYKQIILNQLSRITQKMTAEWSPSGFWNTKMVRGEPVDVWVEDPRQSFISGVKCLYDLITPYMDIKFKEKEVAILKEIEDMKNKRLDFPNPALMNKLQKHTQFDLQNETWITSQMFKTDYAECYRKLFREINLLLKRLNFLETKDFDSKEGG